MFAEDGPAGAYEPVAGLGSFDPSAGALARGQAAEPQGGGAPQGLVAPVAVDPLFGSAGVSVPIRVPAGRKGLTPSLALSYSSGGEHSAFGQGWDLSFGVLRRNPAFGVPFDYENEAATYSDRHGFVLGGAAGVAELDTHLGSLPGAAGCEQWASSFEDRWLQACFERSQNRWTVTDARGVRYTFGDVATARNGVQPAFADLTSEWHLTRIEDPSGNRIEASYQRIDGHVYLSEVRWGANPAAGLEHLFFVRLQLEDRDDDTRSYRGGFADILAQRVASITVVTSGAAVPGGSSVESLLFTYSLRYGYATDTQRSQLLEVRLTGPTGTELQRPSRFQYSASGAAVAPGSFYGIDDWVGAFESDSHGGMLSGWSDVQGDGLPDFLTEKSFPNYLSEGAILYENRFGASESYDFAVWDENPSHPGLWASFHGCGFTTPLMPFCWANIYGKQIAFSGKFGGMRDFDGDSIPDYLQVATELDGSIEGCWGTNSLYQGDDCELSWFRGTAAGIELDSVDVSGWPGEFEGLPNQRQNHPSGALVDVTGDGRPDLVHCQTDDVDPSLCHAYVADADAQGNPTYVDQGTTRWRVPTGADASGAFHGRLSSTTYGSHVAEDLLDINGDSLPDLLFLNAAGGWMVHFGNGKGWQSAPVAWPGVPAGTYLERTRLRYYGCPNPSQDRDNCVAGPKLDRPKKCYENGVCSEMPNSAELHVVSGLRDMNGDGLPDFVNADRPVNQPWQVYLNTGAGFAAPVPWGGTNDLEYLTGIFDGNSYGDVMDMNGDGVADFLRGGVTERTLRRGLGLPSGLLTRVENGLGASTSIAYEEAHETLNPSIFPLSECVDCGRVPFPVWRVGSVQRSSGLALSGHTLTTEYVFGSPFYDPFKRAFRGFWQSSQTEVGTDPGPPATIVRQYAPPSFADGDPLRLPESTWPGEIPSEPFRQTYEWRALFYGNGWNSIVEWFHDWSAAPPDSAGRQQVKLAETTTRNSGRVASLNVVQERRESYTYDAFLNPIRQVTRASTDSGSGPVADALPVVTTADYLAGGSCRALPTRLRIAEDSNPDDGTPGFVLSDRSFTFDTRCNLLTATAKLAAAGVAADTGAPVTVLQMGYAVGVASAAAGLPTSITNALNATTVVLYDAQSMYPATVTDHLGQSTTTTTDLRWGQPLSVADANGALTSYTYDSLGRLLGIARPCSSGACPFQSHVYTHADPANGTFVSRVDRFLREPNDPSGYRQESTFFDSFGRTLQSRRQQYVATVGQVIVSGASELDDYGRPVKQYLPYVDPAGTLENFVATDPNGGWEYNLTAYDGFGRTTSTTQIDGTQQIFDVRLPQRSITYDENFVANCGNPLSGSPAPGCSGGKVVEERDALGRVVRSVSYDGTKKITETTNVHDGLGRIERNIVWDWTRPIVPHPTAVTEFEYDSLGRRTGMLDPNSGRWAYVFDAAGNLLFQDDPKPDQHVAFCYDQLGRVTRKLRRSGAAPTTPSTSHCGAGASGSVTTYTYGTNSAAFERGRLKEVLDAYPEEQATVRTRFEYDRRGRTTREERMRELTVDTTLYSRTAAMRFAYDAADRVTTLYYPGSSTDEAITQLYDRYGMPAAVNGVSQSYAYGPTYDQFGHLTSWTDGSGLLHSANYAGRRHALSSLRVNNPQVAGDLLRLDYTSYDPAGNLLAIDDTVSPALLSNDWQYQYDGLARLVGATGWGGTTPFVYDGLGNMTRGNGLDFEQLDPGDDDWPDDVDDDPLTPDLGVAPHQTRKIRAVSSGSGTPAPWLGQVYDANGALEQTQTPNLSLTVDYDGEGRVREVDSAGSMTRSIYDYSGARVARIIDDGLPTKRLTMYFGDWFEVTGSTVTRNLSFAGRRIAVSPVGAPSTLTLARADTEQTWLASLGWDGNGLTPASITPTVLASAITTTGASLLLLTIVVTRRRRQPTVYGLEPLAFSLQPTRFRSSASLSKPNRRRRPVAAITLLAFSATQLPYLPPAEASSGPPSTPPPKPVFFIHTDHLGSTQLLTCFGQGTTLGCADRAVYRQYRYDAYGRTKVFNAAGTQLTPGPQPTERLYTGQVWDWNASVYHYVARVYVPELARFTSTDPVREYANPYAYVKWAPTGLTDPTGMFALGGWVSLHVADADSKSDSATAAAGYAALLEYRAPGRGGFTGPNGGGSDGGFGPGGLLGLDVLAKQLGSATKGSLGSQIEAIVLNPGKGFKSAAGHFATRLGSRVYTFGQGGWHKKSYSLAEYLKDNDYRDAVGLSLGLSAAEAAAVKGSFLATVALDAPYNVPWNNCTDALEQAIEGLGVNLGINVTPYGTGSALINAGLVVNATYYPAAESVDQGGGIVADLISEFRGR